jgi:hypothetical protein
MREFEKIIDERPRQGSDTACTSGFQGYADRAGKTDETHMILDDLTMYYCFRY